MKKGEQEQAINMDIWHGRVDLGEGTKAKRWHQVIAPYQGQKEGTTIIGFASDEGVKRNQGRVGAKEGPVAIRKAVANLAWSSERSLYDAGDIHTYQDLEESQAQFATKVCDILDNDNTLSAIGGGHEIGYASFSGFVQHISKHHPKAKVGIINFDAHLDLREDQQATSGTPFYQCAKLCETLNMPFHYTCLGVSKYNNTEALFERAERLNTRIVFDEDINSWDLSAYEKAINKAIDEVDYLYLTICLDVLPAYVAPGVSAPASRGVELPILEHGLKQILNSNKVKMADIAELNPELDKDNITAKVAARLLSLMASRK
ncbi:formimidoylglutamase [Vibrio algivorus]|uniref:Formimidoylglutamase n=1 Tax=Vibrio algivorus TaxID=1667024 RepID=A0A557P077_9VIBR|nr:formimidoylglutamase [Vibrio algivorus]TVO34029.1 formimidoylglutamase [Vibrio algivorus]GLT13780.1 formimidoylglutamase [Vibrio algivorus]